MRSAIAIRSFAAASILAPLALAAVCQAGDLTPSAGPISPSMKPLDIVEPRIAINNDNTPGDAGATYRITKPGAYYLTNPIEGQAGKHAIEIATDNVTIDLMGFSVTGVNSLEGITTDGAACTQICVMNGAVNRFDQDGIDFSNCTGVRLIDVRANDNGLTGMRTGTSGIVTGCFAENNGSYGISTGSGTVVKNCTVRNNDRGIAGGISVLISDCAAYENGRGFSLGRNSRVDNCTASFNTDVGISASRECYVLNNNCIGNGVGIRDTFGQNRIEGNHCSQNSIGFEITDNYNYIVRNTATINGTNWDVAAGNAILVIEAQRDMAGFTGDSGGVSPGSTDPNANYSIVIP